MDFNFEKLSQSDQVKAMICRTTLIGVVNTGYNLCQSLRWYYKDANNDSKKILTGLSSWYANELVESENKLIMGFNKWAEKNQHLWKEFVTGVPFKRDYMAKSLVIEGAYFIFKDLATLETSFPPQHILQ